MQKERFSYAGALEFVILGTIGIVIIVGLFINQLGRAIPSEIPRAERTDTGTSRVDQPGNAPQSTAAGDLIPLPAGLSGDEPVTLISAGEAPLISKQDAMQVVSEIDVPWALGGEYQGQAVNVQAWYGLATLGYSGPHGWVGSLNVPLPTGEVLPHIENRPMWIIDYGNTVFSGMCGTCAYNHTLYAVDAQTRGIVKIWGYDDRVAPQTMTAPLAAQAASIGKDERIWEETQQGTNGAIDPLLRPGTLPDGFDTVWQAGASPSYFRVVYHGPDQELWLEGGGTQRPEPEALTEVRQVTVRGRPTTLHIIHSARGYEGARLWWEEPGQWKQPDEIGPQDTVPYFLWASGLSPEELQRVAESLSNWQ